jgi:DNA-directed RNA polymerase subunit N
MPVPVRCFTCLRVVNDRFYEYSELMARDPQMNQTEAMLAVGVKDACCRQKLLSFIDLATQMVLAQSTNYTWREDPEVTREASRVEEDERKQQMSLLTADGYQFAWYQPGSVNDSIRASVVGQRRELDPPPTDFHGEPPSGTAGYTSIKRRRHEARFDWLWKQMGDQ